MLPSYSVDKTFVYKFPFSLQKKYEFTPGQTAILIDYYETRGMKRAAMTKIGDLIRECAGKLGMNASEIKHILVGIFG